MNTIRAVELGVLGPLQVRQDGTPVVIPGAKPRAILTMLGLHGGSVVSAEALVELLWGEDPPRTAAKALQTHISSLRRALGDGFVLTEGMGWTLAESEVDASRYKAVARLGRDAVAVGDSSQAVACFEEALALWRGTPELPDGRRGTSEKTRWVEGHAALVEDRADALLATGRAAEIIGDLESAVADAPLRERRWGQLMLALYRAGRQGEALSAFQRARALLADELGVDPGPDLRKLEAAIVAQEAALDVIAAQRLASVTRAVTFLLTDIEGSTAAWEAEADAMAVALARHDELVEQVVTSRGGRLIKTRGEGDATFSVFDRPSAAAAAALELQDAIVHEPWTLRAPMRIRVALHTGEVELRDGDYFGRAVNRAARLRSLAVGGQILCSGATSELVIDSLPDDVVLADLGLRELRNLARPEHVFELRLETAEEGAQPPTSEPPMERPGLPSVLIGSGPFVGRRSELERLLSAWQTSLSGGACAALIAGEPGVGKTRLAGEWSRQAYEQGAVVLYGRCDEDLGAPYQPFAEALRSLVPCVGAGRLRGLRGVEALLPLVPGLTDVVPDLAAPTRADPDTERYALFDAVVALVEMASTEAPVVLVLDDLHWAAKPTLLLLRHLLRFGDRARVEIVGTYRSTDLDRSHPLAAMLADLHRDGTASRISLSGLDEDDVTAYVAEAGYDDEELGHALASVTGGNPFFLIEALRHVDESGGVWDPSTLPQGVREAVSRRLSRLPIETNKALAAAAVVGSRFALDLVERVVGDDLVDAFDEAAKAGIVIEEPGGRYRFNHAIVRQSLLAELSSMRRMRLHQRIATTLEDEPGADDELLAELAHHYFECAWAGNAAKAVEYCRRAADQAMARLAYEGAAELYDHAVHALEELDDELPDRDDQNADLLVARCEALLAAGDVASAAGAVSQLQEATVDSARLSAWATCFDGQLSVLVHPERLDDVESALGVAAQKLAEIGDAAGEAKAHTVRATCLARLGRIGDCEVALDDALTAARRAREHRRVNAVLAGAPLAALWGPNPVPRAGGRCLDVVRLLRITTDSPAVEATSTRCQAVLEAFRGRDAAARRMIDSARRTVTELGLRHALLEVEQFAGIVELVLDDPAAAEPHLRQAYNGFRRMGLDADTAETAALLGRACLALNRDAEADELCTESERLAGHAFKPGIAWRTVRAQLLSRGNDHEDARRVAQAAITLAERTDALVDHGDACLSLATVLGAAGDAAGAQSVAERAVDLYERKGAATLAEKARTVFGGLAQSSASAASEPARVELDNACVRAIVNSDACLDRGDLDEFERCFAADFFFESRRKVVGFSGTDIGSGNWQRTIRQIFESGEAVLHRHVIVAVRGERLALCRAEYGPPDVSPGAARVELLQLLCIDEDGRYAFEVWFDIEDIDAATAELDAAHARFEEEHAQARRLENAASHAYGRLHAYFAARDWDAMPAMLADDSLMDDRRQVVGAGVRCGRDATMAAWRAIADLGVTTITSVAIATRGTRLALCRTRAGTSGAFETEALQIVDIDADERMVAVISFGLDEFDSALKELESRYLAGEAAAYTGTWSGIVNAFALFNRHELANLTPDWVSVDHRRGASFAAGDMAAYIHDLWADSPDINIYIEVVHRVSNLGAVITQATHATSQHGFEAEWRENSIFTFDGDLVSRCELFDEKDLGTALARFDQLSRPAPRLENAASRVFENEWSHFAARDWDALAELVADNYSGVDHRRVVRAENQHGRDVVVKDLQAAADVGFTISMVSAIAIRGERLVLARVRASGRDPNAIQNDAFNIVEIDSDGRILAALTFDLEDFDAAIGELDARYLAGEGAAHSHTWSVIAAGYAGFNQRQLLATMPDWVSIDHRRGAAFAPGDMIAYIQAAWDDSPDTKIYIEAVHQLSEIGAVVSHVARGISQEGFDAEWRDVHVLAVEGEMLSRSELFDEADLDAALARFDQLSRPVPRLENRAILVTERFRAHFAARDWAALGEILADGFSSDDRRRVVGAGVRQGRDAQVANMRAIAELWSTNVTRSVVATRGRDLVLVRLTFSRRDEGVEAFLAEVLMIVEIDADEKLASMVTFDLEDFGAAFEELDARYLAGQAAPHARTWSVIVEGYASLNRRELPPTTPDWVNIDHRRATSIAPGGIPELLTAAWNVTSDLNNFVEAVHRLDNLGGVVTHVANETSQEGFHAEWRVVSVFTVEGDVVHRCEVFDEADLDAAIARFEELSRSAPRLENTASRANSRYLACFNARDWDTMASILADDCHRDDRRRVTGTGTRRGRDAEIENMRVLAGLGVTATAEVIAIRGDRITLTHTRASVDQQQQGFLADALLLIEADLDGRLAATIMLDLEDIDAAIAELDARYLVGEAATYARTWSVISGSYAAINRHELPLTTPDCANIDHRRETAMGVGDLIAYISARPDRDQNNKAYVEAVHRLTGRGAVVTYAAHETSRAGFDAEWRGIAVFTVEGDLINRTEVFDDGDLDAALATFEQLDPPTPRPENTATGMFERLYAHVAAGEWHAVVQITAENVCVDDRRRVVNAGILHGRDANIKDAQATVGVGFTMTMLGVLATRGERLALTGIRVSGRDPAAIQNDALQIMEIDAEERIAGVVVFDLEAIDAAFEELDARYLAGEAAAHAHTWSLVAAAYECYNRRELPPTTPDWVNVDRRRMTMYAPGDVFKYVRGGWDYISDISFRIEAVHRLSDLGAVVTHTGRGTSQEGFGAEWREIHVMTVEGDLFNRSEMFDEADLDGAVARIEELHPRPPQLENMASRVDKRFQACFAARDWDLTAEMLSGGFSIEDRRRVVNMGNTDGRDAELTVHAYAAVGTENVKSTVIATRAQRLVLTHYRFSGRDEQPDAFRVEMLAVVEIDADERMAAVVVFDIDDIDSAIAELDARYLAGEAAPHSVMWSAVTQNYVALNRHALPLMTPDAVSVDHRRGRAFAPGDLPAYLEASWELMPQSSLYIADVHRLNDVGAVVTHVVHGTTAEGFAAEWREIIVLQGAGDRMSRCEMFDEEDFDAAIGKFDQLTRQAPHLENAASQVSELFLARFVAGDWHAMAEILAGDFSSDDRRRVVGAGVRHGRDAEITDMRTIAELWKADATSTVVATRGGRLVLSRYRYWARNGGSDAFLTEVLSVIEINAEQQIVASATFDIDDVDAAFAELDARYLAGEAAPASHTWSVITRAYAAFNRHELPATDWTTIDRRRATPFETSTLTDTLRGMWDLTPDLKIRIEVVHRLNSFGAVITHAGRGTSPEGFDAEWRAVDVLTIDGDSIISCEVFDEEDLDAALARIDELHPRSGRLEHPVQERFLAHFAARDWHSVGQVFAVDYYCDDRRRVVNAGVRHGRDAAIGDLRVAAEIGLATNITSDIIATRGERLILTRFRVSNRDDSATQDVLQVVEHNAEEEIAAAVVFDLDDIDAATAELDARYLAGEAGADAHTWSVIARFNDAFNRREIPPTDWVTIDHRPLITADTSDLPALIRDLWSRTPDLSMQVEAVHQLSSFGAVITRVLHGTSREGFEAEWRMIQLLAVEGDQISRSELFDETDLDAALARLEELHPQAPRLENAASQVTERYWKHYAAREWAAMAELVALDISTEDRRRVVNAGIQHGRDDHMADMRAIFEVLPDADIRSAIMATRGVRLILTRICILSSRTEVSEVITEVVRIDQVDADNRIASGIAFDIDDFDAAIAELDAWYLAGEAAVHADTWSLIAQAYTAVNRHELPPTTPDWVNIDHRRGRAFAPGDLEAYLHATWDLAPDVTVYVEAVHRLSNLGGVITHCAHGSSREGFDAEWREVILLAFEAGSVNHFEVFDETDLDAALARFDELDRQTSASENVATATWERLVKAYNRRDVDGFLALTTQDGRSEDRRKGLRHVAVGLEWQKTTRAWLDAPRSWRLDVEILAIRGSRLSLSRNRCRDTEEADQPVTAEILAVTEVNEDGLVCNAVSFDPGDIDDAIAELNTRWIASGDAVDSDDGVAGTPQEAI